MKNYSLFPFLLILSFNLTAQKTKITWGPETKTKILPQSTKRIGVEDDYFYILNDIKKKKKTVLRFNLKDGETTESDFDLRYNGDPLEKLSFINTANNIIGVSAISYKKNKSLELIAFDLKNGEFTEPIPVYEHAFKRYTKGIEPILWIPESNEDLEAGIFQSFDKTKVLFANALSNQDTKNEDKMAIAVFDENMKLLWDKIQDFPYKDKKLEIMGAYVADNGNEVFVSASFVKNKKSYDYKIFRITENDFREYELVLNEKVNPTAIALFYNESQQSLVLGGVYVLKAEGIPHGVFSGKLDLSMNFNNELNYSPFDKEEKDKNTKADYRMVGLASLSNGSFQFLIEGAYVVSMSTGTPGIFDYRYFYTDFIFATVDNEGGLVSSYKLERKVVSEKFPKNSLSFFPYGDYTYLLFDAKVTDEDKRKYKLKSFLNLATIGKLYAFDQNGKLIRQKMLFTSSDKDYFSYNVIAAVFKNQLFFLGMKLNYGSNFTYQRTVRLGSIDLDNFQ